MRHHHLATPLIASAMLLTLSACSKVGDLQDPYADMDQGGGQDMGPSTSTPPDMRKDEPVDRGTGVDEEDATMRPAPTEVQAVASEDGVIVTWLPSGNALRYEVRVNGGVWQNNGVAMSFEHTDAPGGTITSANIIASDMTERPHVELSIEDLVTEDGPEQTYEVRAIYPDGASGPSQPATARRLFSIESITWERQDTPETGEWKALENTSGVELTTLDLEASPEGNLHAYQAIITPTLGTSFTTEPDTGARLAAVQVATGLVHACALLNSGEVRCWGDNSSGQLGTGDTVQLSQDVDMYEVAKAKLPIKAVDIAGGLTSTCVIGEDSNLYCWGSFDSTILPYDDTTGEPRIIQLNPSDINVKSIPDTYHQHLCFVTQDDDVRCFWRNGNGQCGAGVSNLYLTVSLLSDVDLGGAPVSHVSESFHHTCAHLMNKQVICWGNNYWTRNAQTIIGTQMDDMPPPPLNTSTIGEVDGVFGGGMFTGCFKNNGNRMRCWGKGSDVGLLGVGHNRDISPPGERPVVTQGLFFIPSKIAIGYNNVCVLSDARDLYCWGDGETGVNGNGTTYSVGISAEDRLEEPLLLGGPVDSISTSGNASACAVVKGDVRCWGRNTSLKLGRPGLTLSAIIGDEPGEMPPAPVQLW